MGLYYPRKVFIRESDDHWIFLCLFHGPTYHVDLVCPSCLLGISLPCPVWLASISESANYSVNLENGKLAVLFPSRRRALSSILFSPFPIFPSSLIFPWIFVLTPSTRAFAYVPLQLSLVVVIDFLYITSFRGYFSPFLAQEPNQLPVPDELLY